MIILFLACLTAIESRAQEDSIKVERLPFNSRIYNDLAPVIMEDGLLFSSDRKTTIFVDYKTLDDKRILNLYFAERKDSLNWGGAKPFSKNLKTEFNEGYASYHEETKTLYFTRNLSLDKKNRTSENYVGIFYARKSGDRWVNVRPFPFNDPAYHVAFPSISKDGDELYFASNKPDGYGGFDLYVSRLENGSWSEPQNLGPRINSSRSEQYPYISDDGRLYFASNNNSMGGLDIFYASRFGASWTAPVRLDPPINSRADDFGFIRDAAGSSGYFTSNRANTDDVYRFSALEPPEPGITFDDCSEQGENSYCYLFYESGVMDLDTLPYIYEWELGDGTRKRGLSVEHCFDTAGMYRVQLNVIDSLMGQVMYNEASYEFEAIPIEQAYITVADTTTIGDPIHFDGTIETYLPGFTVQQYYWDFGDGMQSEGPQTEHVFEVPGTYRINLKIIGSSIDLGEYKEYCNYKNVVVMERNP